MKKVVPVLTLFVLLSLPFSTTQAADLALTPGDTFAYAQTDTGESLIYAPLQSGVRYLFFTTYKGCCYLDKIAALLVDPASDPIAATLDSGESIYTSTLKTGETLYLASLSGVLYTEQEIGIMADRIGEMADRIVYTEDLIVTTEYLIVDVTRFSQENFLVFIGLLMPWSFI